MSKKSYNVYFDYGFNSIKAIVNDEMQNEVNRISYPSLKTEFEGKIKQDESKFKYLTKVAEQKYLVGKSALATGVKHSWNEEQQLNIDNFEIFLSTVIKESGIDEDIQINLVVGLPIDHFNKQHKALKKQLKGFSFEANDINITVSDVEVEQQGLGAFYSLCFDNLGNPIEEVINQLKYGCLIIDVGGGSTDVVTIRIVDGAFQIDETAFTIYRKSMNALYEKIAERVGNISSSKIEESVLNHGNIVYYAGVQTDISEILQDEIKTLSTEIEQELINNNIDINEFSYKLFTGGGAKEVIKNFNCKDKFLQLNAIWGNCEGFRIKYMIDNKLNNLQEIKIKKAN